jgi:eukaryotic-like serine/threonine-protein kinase
MVTPRRLQAVSLAELLRAKTGSCLRDRYVLGRTLADNEHAAVIEAADRRMRRAVAVKLFEPPGGEAQAVAEARLAAIDHPNLCKVLDADHANGVPYIILERLKGETLAECLAARTRLPVPDAVELFMQLLSALDAVHERGIIHRDVKPSNVFLIPRPGCLPVVKLFDFASSIRLGEPMPGHGSVGTRAYMAPEQASHDVHELDVRADLYAVGTMMFEAIAGRRPFTMPSYDALVGDASHRTEIDIRQIAPHVSPELAAVIARAMEASPERRFSDARAFQHALSTLSLEPTSGIHQRPGSPSATRVEVPAPNRAPRIRAASEETRVVTPREDTVTAAVARPAASSEIPLTPTRIAPLVVSEPAPSTVPLPPQNARDHRTVHRLVSPAPIAVPGMSATSPSLTPMPMPYVTPSSVPPPPVSERPPREVPVGTIALAIACGIIVLALATIALLFY